MRRVVFGLLGLAACEPEPELPPPLPGHLCASEEQAIELAPPEGSFGDLVDGSDLWCGNPPQGGAPYTPFRVRFVGPEEYEDGVLIDLSAVDNETGETLASTEVALGLVCANVGESANKWVGAEAHMRYDGWPLPELEGRDAHLTVAAVPVVGDVLPVEGEWDVRLVLELPEDP